MPGLGGRPERGVGKGRYTGVKRSDRGRSRRGLQRPRPAQNDAAQVHGLQTNGAQANSAPSSRTGTAGGSSFGALAKDLQSLDNQQYGAYKWLLGGCWIHEDSWKLKINHVQADPFAPPSRASVFMPLGRARFPASLLATETKRTALGDYLSRIAASYIRAKHLDQTFTTSGWSGPKGGALNINAPGQEVLQRTSCLIKEDKIELRLTVSLPARGRSILGREAATILTRNIPELVKSTLRYDSLDASECFRHVHSVNNQRCLRSQLKKNGLVAFVGNGSVLPRQSGATSLPMHGASTVPFISPKELEVQLEDLDSVPVLGMGIRKGVTVLTGGGFHGKSTLLEAIQLGVYDHIPGDGRERVVTEPTAIKVRAEDGRSVQVLDISPFIHDLPGGKDCKRFCTEDASGSTSMAATIQESLALGSKLLLIDEDSSATNLLVRDQRMQTLIQAETITPFICSVTALSCKHDVSTIIVVGGLGDYLTVADTVIGMQSYTPKDLTKASRQIVNRLPTQLRVAENFEMPMDCICRLPPSLAKGRAPLARGLNFIKMDDSDSYNAVKTLAEAESGIDLSGQEQIVEYGQLRFAAEFLRYCARNLEGKSVGCLARLVEEQDLDEFHVEGHAAGDLVRARSFELGAVLNRLRGIEIQ